MININGLYLLKLFILFMLHELYSQEDVTNKLNLCVLNTSLKISLLENLTRIIKNKDVLSNLLDFSHTVFSCFSENRRQIRTNNASLKSFVYLTEDDDRLGFSRRHFVLFLKELSLTELLNLNKLQHVIISILEHVDFIFSKITEKNIDIKFNETKYIECISKYTAIEFEFKSRDEKIFIHNNKRNNHKLDYEIEKAHYY